MTTSAERRPVDLASAPHTRRTLGIAAGSGLAIFLLSLGGLSTPKKPETGQATAAEIRRYAAENAATLKLGLVITMVGIVLFVVFVAALAQLARDIRPHSVVPGVLLLCGAVTIVHELLNTAVRAIFAFPHEVDSVSDSTLVAWYDLEGVVEFFGAMVRLAPNMVLIAAFSVLALRARLMARWVCWAGLAVAACGLAGAVDVLDVLGPVPFFVALFGFWLWPLAIGGALGVRWLKARRTTPHS